MENISSRSVEKEVANFFMTEPNTQSGNCILCRALTEGVCATCGDFYCSVACQRKDWQIHRRFCVRMPQLIKAGEFREMYNIDSGIVNSPPDYDMENLRDDLKNIPKFIKNDSSSVGKRQPSPDSAKNHRQNEGVFFKDEITYTNGDGMENRDTDLKNTPKFNKFQLPVDAKRQTSSDVSETFSLNDSSGGYVPPNHSRVFISRFRSANRLTVRSSATADDNEYQRILKTVHEYGKSAPKLSNDIKNYKYVISQFKGKMCRAKIGNVNQVDKSVFVHLYDYGNNIKLQLDDLREITDEIINLPILTYEVRLHKVYHHPISYETRNFFNQFYNKEAQIVYKTENLKYVNLLFVEINQTLNNIINQHFLKNSTNTNQKTAGSVNGEEDIANNPESLEYTQNYEPVDQKLKKQPFSDKANSSNNYENTEETSNVDDSKSNQRFKNPFKNNVNLGEDQGNSERLKTRNESKTTNDTFNSEGNRRNVRNMSIDAYSENNQENRIKQQFSQHSSSDTDNLSSPVKNHNKRGNNNYNARPTDNAENRRSSGNTNNTAKNTDHTDHRKGGRNTDYNARLTDGVDHFNRGGKNNQNAISPSDQKHRNRSGHSGSHSRPSNDEEYLNSGGNFSNSSRLSKNHDHRNKGQNDEYYARSSDEAESFDRSGKYNTNVRSSDNPDYQRKVGNTEYNVKSSGNVEFFNRGENSSIGARSSDNPDLQNKFRNTNYNVRSVDVEEYYYKGANSTNNTRSLDNPDCRNRGGNNNVRSPDNQESRNRGGNNHNNASGNSGNRKRGGNKNNNVRSPGNEIPPKYKGTTFSNERNHGDYKGYSDSETNRQNSSQAEKSNQNMDKITERIYSDDKSNVKNMAISGKDIHTEETTMFVKKEKQPFTNVFLEKDEENVSGILTDTGSLDIGVFGFIKKEHITHLQCIQSAVEEAIRSDNSESYEPKIGDFCLACFDGGWYRAKVFGEKKGLFMVYYVDFTNIEKVKKENIRPYPDNLTQTCYTTWCIIQGFPANASAKQIGFINDYFADENCIIEKVGEMSKEGGFERVEVQLNKFLVELKKVN